MNSVQLDRLFSVTIKCLHAALYVASGNYSVIPEEQSDGESLKKSMSQMEDICRKYSWRATENSVRTLLNNSYILLGAFF